MTFASSLATKGALEESCCYIKKDNIHRILKHTLSLQVILIDAVCEAEYHRPDRGDTIASFLTRHAPNIPSWLKIVCTVRTQLLDCAKQLPYTRITLDRTTNDAAVGNGIARDLSDYVNYRLAQSTSIQANVTASINGKAESSCSASQMRFSSHLLALAKGSFLFAKLTLDLIESGHLVAKSASYKARISVISITEHTPRNFIASRFNDGEKKDNLTRVFSFFFRSCRSPSHRFFSCILT